VRGHCSYPLLTFPEALLDVATTGGALARSYESSAVTGFRLAHMRDRPQASRADLTLKNAPGADTARSWRQLGSVGLG
jgi:hypothetical protein